MRKPTAPLSATLAHLTQWGLIPGKLDALDITDTAKMLNANPSIRGVFTERLPLKPRDKQMLLVANPHEITWVNLVTTLERHEIEPHMLKGRHDENKAAIRKLAKKTTHVLRTRSIWAGLGDPMYACDGITWLGANGCLLRHTIVPPDASAPYAETLTPQEWEDGFAMTAWPVRITLEALALEHRRPTPRTVSA